MGRLGTVPKGLFRRDISGGLFQIAHFRLDISDGTFRDISERIFQVAPFILKIQIGLLGTFQKGYLQMERTFQKSHLR